MDANQIEKLTTEAARLCTWLRANSSGVYRPAAEAATVIEELIAEVERLRADADRYRWLRNDPPVSLAVRRHPGETERGCYLDGWNLDDAIDAAIASHTKAGKDTA